jgi:Transmembrane protein 43
MIEAAEKESEVLTWVLRAAGFVLMAGGIFLVFKPLAVIADVLPFFGDLLSLGIVLFALLVALPLSLITIALGWVFYRPLVGIPPPRRRPGDPWRRFLPRPSPQGRRQGGQTARWEHG